MGKFTLRNLIEIIALHAIISNDGRGMQATALVVSNAINGLVPSSSDTSGGLLKL